MMAANRLHAALATSTIVSLASGWAATLHRMTASSLVFSSLQRLFAALRQLWATSSTGAGTSRVRTTGQRWIAHSVVGSSAATVTDRTTIIVRNARASASFTRLTSALTRWVRSAWLYRWLTAEPDPEVIVIDLRDTFSVGPFIAAVDRLVTLLLPATARSTLVRLAIHGMDRVRNAPIRIVSYGALLALLTITLLVSLTGIPSAPFLAMVVVLGVLALLGTRITHDWATIRQHRISVALAAIFEPPEPPNREK